MVSRNYQRHLILILTLILLIYVWFSRNSETVSKSIDVPDTLTSFKLNKIKACILVLCRETDLNPLTKTMLNFEQRFNSKYNYDYVIFNEKLFSDDFKQSIRNITKSEVKFGHIPKEHWSYPSHIDQERARLGRDKLRQATGMDFSEAYRFMCRFFSGYFFQHPLVQEYEYFWRVEPEAEYTCDINYDPFQFMNSKGIEYGFTIAFTETQATLPTLWQETVKFMNENPNSVDKTSNYLQLITDNSKSKYNLCQFWSNFEIASFKFFRSERYLKYFEHLEQAGGFFYERWGDAPVHTIAASMFLPKSKIHFFEDIGYKHIWLENCPKESKGCSCYHRSSFKWRGDSCLKYW